MELPLSNKREKHLRNEYTLKTPLPRKFMVMNRWKVDAKNGPAQTLLVSPIYLFAFFQKPKTFFLCLITSLQIYSSLLICYIIPSTNHPFGLLTTVFLLCIFMIHVIINWFFFLFLVKKSNQDILLTLLTFF